MAILYIASEARELKSFAARLTGLRPLKWPLDYAQEGILDDRRILLAANGAGPKLAAHALEIAIRAISAADLQSSVLELVVNVGFCGALQSSLREGQILVATQIIEADTGQVYSLVDAAVTMESGLEFTSGRFVSQNRIASTSAEKNELGARWDAVAVEMEAAGVADRAKRAGLPFCCIKIVSDRADESFRINFNEVRDQTGRLSRGKIVLHAVGNVRAIPELFRLKRRADLAASALGDFLVSCRFNIRSTGSVVTVDNSVDVN